MKTNWYSFLLTYKEIRGNNLFVICLLFFSLLGCDSGKYGQYETEIKKILLSNKREESLDQKIYIFTSLDGCGSCLEYTIKFIETKTSDPDVVAIIASKSPIRLKNTFSDAARSRKNFIVESSLDLFSNKVLDYEHPVIYICRDGKIIDRRELTYLNAKKTISDLNRFLETNVYEEAAKL